MRVNGHLPLTRYILAGKEEISLAYYSDFHSLNNLKIDSETDIKDIIFLMKFLKIDTTKKENLVIESAFKAEHILPKKSMLL